MDEELSLHEQVLKTSQQGEAIAKRLKPHDPARDWFQLQLRKFAIQENEAELPLEEANARLAALRQLLYLIRDHSVRLQNPDYEEPVKNFPDSFLTVQARIPDNVLNSARELGLTIAPTLLHDPAMVNEQFDPVSPTAKVVSYLRGLDKSLQITAPFSPETDGEALLQELGITDAETQASMAALFQSRYHAMNAAISGQEHDARQIIEFASGISPRGYQWARMSPGTIYVESDLPQLMVHKAKLVRNAYLTQGEKARGVHHCCAADVLNRDSLFAAIENMDTARPFTLVTEGLLLYFGESEMEQFFANVQAVLTKYPRAVWVTDFVARSHLKDLFDSDSGVAASVKSVFAQVGRSVVPSNPFQTDVCINEWLARFGLATINTVRLKDAAELLRLVVDIPNAQRKRIVGDRRIWCVASK